MEEEEPKKPCKWSDCDEEGTNNVGFNVPTPNGEHIFVLAILCDHHMTMFAGFARQN